MNVLKTAPFSLKEVTVLFSGSIFYPSSLPICLRTLRNVLLPRKTHSLNLLSASHSIHVGFGHLSYGKLLYPFNYCIGETPIPVINYMLDSLFTFMENHFKKWCLEHSVGTSSSVSGMFQQKPICGLFFSFYISLFPSP